MKSRIELEKRLYRRRVMSAAAAMRRFSDGYEHDIGQKIRRAAELRADVIAAVRQLDLDDQTVVEWLARDFDFGRWRCLGYGHYHLTGGRWSFDDFHSHEWPRTYFGDIDFVMHGERCDVKVPWEKSRMQWLAAASLACCFDHDATARERRKKVAMELFDDWVRENPFGVGVNWVSAMEVSIRAINILVSFVLLEDTLDEPERSRFLLSAGEHLHYLRRFPETSDVQGNHYLATMLGLYVLESFAAREDPARRDTLARSFARVCAEQFTADGLHIEFCPIYHRLSLDMVAIGYATMRRACPEVAAVLGPLLERGIKVCRNLSNTAGELPLLGDSDSGKIVDFGQRSRRFGAIASLVCEECNGKAEMRHAASVGDALFGGLLAGISGRVEAPIVSHDCRPDAVRSNHRVLEVGPYLIFESGDQKIVVRCGKLGLSGRGGHDHDDALSFWYAVGGQDVIVEVGCPPYTRDLGERFRAIRSSSHNVVTAAKERFDGSFGSVGLSMRGGPQGRATIQQNEAVCRARCELVPASRAAGGTEPRTHVRTFDVDRAGNISVVDQVSLKSAREFNVYFHLHPRFKDTDIEIDATRALVSWDQRRLLFLWTGDPGTRVVREKYLFHPEYGSALRSERLVVTVKAHGHGELRTEMTLMDQETAAK